MIDLFVAAVWGLVALIFGATALTSAIAIGGSAGVSSPLITASICAVLAYFSWRAARKRYRRVRSDARPRQEAAPATRGGVQLYGEEFYSRVRGVMQCRSRQAAIRKHCRAGMALQLKREPNNRHDQDAIAVYCRGEQIGYLSAEIASQYASDIDDDHVQLSARVKEVIGGTNGKMSYGVNIIITVREC